MISAISSVIGKQSCDQKYTGFFDHCISCDFVKYLFKTIIDISSDLYPVVSKLASSILVAGAVSTVLWLTYYLVSPWKDDLTKQKIMGESLDSGLKIILISVFLSAAYQGIGFSTIYNLAFIYPVTFGLEIVAITLGRISEISPSLYAIVEGTCQDLDKPASALACIVHTNEAALGWIGSALVASVQAAPSLLNLSFFFACYLLLQLLRPLAEGPAVFLKQTFFAAASFAFIPVALALWAFPATRGAGRALLEVSVQSTFTMIFGMIVVVALIASVVSVVDSARSWWIISYDNQADPFDCMVTAFKNEDISLVPWKPTFWVILIISQIYKDLLDEVQALSTFWREAIFSGAR